MCHIRDTLSRKKVVNVGSGEGTVDDRGKGLSDHYSIELLLVSR